jgi:sugar phosphate isomerase/epimerase
MHMTREPCRLRYRSPFQVCGRHQAILHRRAQAGHNEEHYMAKPFKLSILIGDAPDRPPADIAKGFEMSEIPVGLQLLPFATETEWEAQKKKILGWGVPPIKVSSHWFDTTKLFGSGPTTDPELAAFWAKRSFKRLAEMGVEVVGCYGGHFPVPEGFSRTKAMDQAIAYANVMADEAAKYNMVIAFEPMADLNTVFPRYTDGLKFAKEVNRKEVRIMADLAYFLALDQPLEDIMKDPEYCMHCHIAGDDGQPGFGDRVAIHTKLFRIFKDIGYERGVSCACPWVSSEPGKPMNFARETAKTLTYLQNLRDQVYSA